MASKGKESLNCPVCFEVYVDATLLGCGHTFCRKCLTEYDKSQGAETAFMTCPTCRHDTVMGDGRVADLRANVTVNSLVEEFNKTRDWRASTLDMCSEHRTEQREFICQTCQVFICSRCAIFKHKDTTHVVKERHVYETEMRQEIDDKVNRCDDEKENMEKQNLEAEQKREETNATFEALQESIDDVFTDVYQKLKQRRQQIKEDVKTVEQRCNEKLDGIVAAGSKLSARVKSSVGQMAQRRRRGLEEDSLSSHDRFSLEVDELITTCQDWRAETVNSFKEVKEIAEGVRFERCNINLRISEVVGLSKKWEMVKEIALPGDIMNGLAVSSSQSVLMACHKGPDVLNMTLNGDLSTFCTGSGSARDVTVLNTGTVLVSYISGVKQFGESGVTKSTTDIFDIPESSSDKKIDSDSNDNVYVSCQGEKVIHIFKPTGGKPQRSLEVRDRPEQVHTTRCGRIVVQSLASVIVLEASGEEVTTISRPGRVLYPAVDQDDNLYIARVKHDQGIVSLARYTLGGKFVQWIIKSMKIKVKEREWYYMKCPSRDCIVFCTAGDMYIIKNVVA